MLTAGGSKSTGTAAVSRPTCCGPTGTFRKENSPSRRVVTVLSAETRTGMFSSRFSSGS